jgi:cation diffusion facilitator CzcD-associated flavoprotein CzcO
VICADPCGLIALKNLLQAGCRNVVCYEESSGIGGNWVFTDDPHRVSVPECSRAYEALCLGRPRELPAELAGWHDPSIVRSPTAHRVSACAFA